MRDELRRGLEIAALVGFAVVQPVLGPFGESPGTFTAAGAEPGHIVAFAVLVAVVPFVVVWAVAAATRLFGRPVRAGVQTGVVAALAALAAVGVARHLGSGALLRVVVGLVVGASVVVLHRRWAPVGMFLRYASPVPVLLVVVFLLASPVAPLVRPPTVDVEPVAGGDRPSVVYLILDELPTLSLLDGGGGVDARLFPNLARLADTSTWYRNHTAVAGVTQASLPAMLTGRLATTEADQRAAIHANHPDNLITLLARTHRVHGREWATEMCPPSLCADGAAELDDEARALVGSLGDRADPLDTLAAEARSLWWSQVWPTAPDFTAGYALAGMTDLDDATRLVVEFLGGITEQPDGTPVLEYLHASLPHFPWTALPSGESYDAPLAAFGGEVFIPWPGDDVAAAARTRHLLQVQWADTLLGAVIDRLEAADRWDDAVVVVTSDHGAAFEGDRSFRGVEPATQVANGWVPLFVKEPGQADGRIVDDNVTALDVLPTVADLAGVEVDWEMEGLSLVGGPLPPDRPKPMIVPEPEQFENRLEGELVDLDVDGLAEILSAPATGPPDDELRVWRAGRHGDLLGREVADIGVCRGTGPAVTVEPSPAWGDYTAGDLEAGEPLPLWRQGVLDASDSRDVVAVVDGTVAGWSVSLPDHEAWDGNAFGLLLAEPVVREALGDPEFYEVVDEAGCGLRALAR